MIIICSSSWIVIKKDFPKKILYKKTRVNSTHTPLLPCLSIVSRQFSGFDSGRALLAGGVMGMMKGGRGRTRGGLAGIHSGPSCWYARSGTRTPSGVVAPLASANDECLLPARLSSYRSAYG